MFSDQQKVPAPLVPWEKSSILLISPYPDDESTVRAILTGASASISCCDSIAFALDRMSSQPPDVILCEREVTDGDWRMVLAASEACPAPPPVLVVSRHADERLWAEVLNLGGFDVLLKPFDSTEVSRVLGMACQQRRQTETRKAPGAAAGPATLRPQFA